MVLVSQTKCSTHKTHFTFLWQVSAEYFWARLFPSTLVRGESDVGGHKLAKLLDQKVNPQHLTAASKIVRCGKLPGMFEIDPDYASTCKSFWLSWFRCRHQVYINRFRKDWNMAPMLFNSYGEELRFPPGSFFVEYRILMLVARFIKMPK